MQVDLSLLDSKILTLLKSIGLEADSLGLRAYLVGGMVRDILLKHPSIDIDIVVEGDGIAFAQSLTRRLGAALLTHPRFGTAVISLPGGLKLDIVTARREKYNKPGALPVVSQGALEDDSYRRDFTVNTLALSLNQKTFACLRNDQNGLEDLKAGLVRVMHSASFEDDPTRILRAVRYEKRFGFQIEPVSLGLLRKAVKNGLLNAVSPVRYFNEFRRILEEQDPCPALKRLAGLKAVRYVPVTKTSASLLFKARKLLSSLSNPVEDFESWLFYFIVLVDALDRNQIGKLLNDLNLTRDSKRKVLEALQFETVLDMLCRNFDDINLGKFSKEALLFFTFKARSLKLRREILKFL